jgi:acyl-CoA synthetase (AMP-forming)/AMP-acid ligase II/acyl carrier protein
MSHLSPVAQGTNTPRHLCLHHLLQDRAECTPNALAILAPGRAPLTYGRLRAHINDVVQTLHSMGLGRNNRVALMLPNGPETAVAFLAVAAGATCVPLNPAYGANELGFYLAELHAEALIVQAGMDSPARAVAQAGGLRIIELSPALEAEAGLFTLTGETRMRAGPHRFAQPYDVALVLHTSGTTSQPKTVPLTHNTICTWAYDVQAALDLGTSDRCLNVMPLFHAHGLLVTTLTSLVAGASIVYNSGFYAPQFMAWMDAFRPTWYSASPTIHQAILEHATLNREIIARCPLRFIRSSSASLPPQVFIELERVFHAPVIEAYGLTEAHIQITCNPLPPHERKIGSVGRVAGLEVAIMDEVGAMLAAGVIGEVVVRGTTVIPGDDNMPTANRDAFTQRWFRTGDQGYVDADGYLFITGRLKEIINRGGEKIMPWEVDAVLIAHPAVAQAVTFAVPDVRLGEEIAAAVVLHPNTVVTDREIREFAATRLAAFKVPRQVCIVKEIPKSPNGKQQRIGLVEKLRLTTPDQAPPGRQAGFVAPRTPIEVVVAGIWADVLGVKCVGIHDNFFELGGHSLLVTQVIPRLRDVFQIALPLSSVFDVPTVADLAEYIETIRWARHNRQAPPSLSVDDQEEGIL